MSNQILSLNPAGDVTILKAIVGVVARELELRLGYGAGRLDQGYSVLFLLSQIDPSDFIWGDQTKFSGRWQFIDNLYTDAAGNSVGESVPVTALLRDKFGRQFNNDEAKVDAALATFQDEQTRLLNSKTGLNRIVKILPVKTALYDPAKWWETYPNSERHGIPQWTINAKKPIDFEVVAKIGPGGIFAG